MGSRGRRTGELGLATPILVGGVAAAMAAAGVGGFALQRAFADPEQPSVAATTSYGPVAVYPCPGEPGIDQVHGGDRVFIVGVHESADGWLLIRNPARPSERWWVASRFVTPDADLDTLPRVGCDPGPTMAPPTSTTPSRTPGPSKTPTSQAPTTPTESPEPSDSPTQAPTETPTHPPTDKPTDKPTDDPTKPPEPSDPPTTKDPGPSEPPNQAPKVTGIGASPGTVYNDEPTTITVQATDDQGVDKVKLTWSGAFSGAAEMSKSGSSWTFTFTNTGNQFGDVTFKAVAYDADGATSSPASVTVEFNYFG